jgi:hypothetical protein
MGLQKAAGKLVFLDEFDILYGEMAWFWTIGITGQGCNYL